VRLIAGQGSMPAVSAYWPHTTPASLLAVYVGAKPSQAKPSRCRCEWRNDGKSEGATYSDRYLQQAADAESVFLSPLYSIFSWQRHLLPIHTIATTDCAQLIENTT